MVGYSNLKDKEHYHVSNKFEPDFFGDCWEFVEKEK